jgi:DNA-binding protein H-NS
MTQTYSQLVKKIAALQQKAASARAKEISGVVDRIKEAIAFYSLTAKDLGFNALAPAPRQGPAKRAKKRTGKGSAGAAPRFQDGQGNSWGGRGPRPAWLRAALASGRTLEEFATSAPAVSPKAGRKARRAKPALPAKYTDGGGRTWSGRGRRPGWVNEALAQGKPLESLAL